MTKVRYSSEVLVKNGKIRKSTPIGVDGASPDQLCVINGLKSIMNAFLRSRINQRPELADATILVKCKQTETANALSIDFKVQGVTHHARSPEVTE